MSVCVSPVVLQVSSISALFECLLDEEEKALKENPITSQRWAQTVIDVNIIIKVGL